MAHPRKDSSYITSPPYLLAAALQLRCPLQDIVAALDDASITAGSDTVPVVVELHPFSSVTVKLYAPALTVNVPVPKYGAVPPEAVTVTVVVPPLQDIVPALDEATNTAGSDTVPVVVELHPLASVTV
jgi:hypothetical protein